MAKFQNFFGKKGKGGAYTITDARVRISNTKNKHNTKYLAIKTSSRPKKSKKLAENQENRLFYATLIPFNPLPATGII